MEYSVKVSNGITNNNYINFVVIVILPNHEGGECNLANKLLMIYRMIPIMKNVYEIILKMETK
jgi:hypothetical protein